MLFGLLLVLGVLLSVTADGLEFSYQVHFPCGSSQSFADSSSVIQFIHVPKAAGTSIQSAMRSLSKTAKIPNPVSNKCQDLLSNKSRGHIYINHCNIAPHDDDVEPTYIAALRNDIVAYVISLYRYKAGSGTGGPTNHQAQVRKLKQFSTMFKAEGIAESLYLDTIIKRDLWNTTNLAHVRQTSLLCPRANKPCDAGCILRSMLRINVLMTVENISQQWESQMLFWTGHAPNLPRANPSRFPKQVLTDVALNFLRNQSFWEEEQMLVDFAKRLSEVRTEHAEVCLAHQEHCASECAVNVTEVQLQALLTAECHVGIS